MKKKILNILTSILFIFIFFNSINILADSQDDIDIDLYLNFLLQLENENNKNILSPLDTIETIDIETIDKKNKKIDTNNKKNWNLHEKKIYNICSKYTTDNMQIAFILANIEHETANFQHFVELPSKYKSSRLFYKGRGYIQLTHYSNYKNWSKWLNKDLIKNPDLLIEDLDLSAEVACQGTINGSFTAKGTLKDYINNNQTDYYNARALINGDKNKKAGCKNSKCWTIGTKISDRSRQIYEDIIAEEVLQ